MNERDNYNEHKKHISWITFYFYGSNNIAPGVWTSAFPAVRLFGGYTLPPGVPITLPTSRQESLAVFGCLGGYTVPTSDHGPDIETGEFHGLQVSRRLDTASCELSFLIIAGAVEFPHFQ